MITHHLDSLKECLIELLKITGTEIPQESSLSFKDIVNITQKKWLRPMGTERWELKDDFLLKVHRAEIINLLAIMGFIKEIQPTLQSYHSLLILGASDISIIKRIDYVCQLWQEGIRYQKTYLLCGETETEFMEKLYKKKCLPLGMNMPITVMAKQHKNGYRANTEDTLKVWLEKKDAGKNILAISNQPFVLYQGKVAARMLRPLYHQETVGVMVGSSVRVSVILDSVARYLYECYHQRHD